MDPSDLCPQGDPETVVLLSTGAIVGLNIRGVRGQVLLGIREDKDGQPVSCAYGDVLYLSQPSHGYGYTEEDRT